MNALHFARIRTGLLLVSLVAPLAVARAVDQPPVPKAGTPNQAASQSAAAGATEAAVKAAPVVAAAWARATAPGMNVGAAYLIIRGGTVADRLVSASSPRAEMVQLHTVEDEAGMAKMRAVEGIDVPAGQRVELAPSGRHLMLMGLDAPLVAGQSFELTLRFATAGEQTVRVHVQPATVGVNPSPH